MKPIKDCEYEIEIMSIYNSIGTAYEYFWDARTSDPLKRNGTDGFNMESFCATREDAIKRWEEFATTNGIDNYTILP